MDALHKAKELRANLTSPERVLWSRLRNQQLGIKFRRQVPFPPYIVDFYCSEFKLIIELDGDTHAETAAYDMKRTVFLEQNGLRVVRFTNQNVMKNLEGVLSSIMMFCTPHPTPLPQGERE